MRAVKYLLVLAMACVTCVSCYMDVPKVEFSERKLEVPAEGMYAEVFNTDDTAYGGSGVTNTGVQFRSESVGGKQAVRLRLPPLGGCVLRCTRKKTAGRPQTRKQKDMRQ